jgi:hypothetical protein
VKWGAVGWGGAECHIVLDVLSNANAETRQTPTHRTTHSPDGVLPSPERDAGAAPIGSLTPEATEAGKNGVDAEGLRDSRAAQKQE